MPQWCDNINLWFTDSIDDRWTDEGYVEYVYSVSRYYYIAQSIDYYFTTIPQSYHFVTQSSADYFST